MSVTYKSPLKNSRVKSDLSTLFSAREMQILSDIKRRELQSASLAPPEMNNS